MLFGLRVADSRNFVAWQLSASEFRDKTLDILAKLMALLSESFQLAQAVG